MRTATTGGYGACYSTLHAALRRRSCSRSTAIISITFCVLFSDCFRPPLSASSSLCAKYFYQPVWFILFYLARRPELIVTFKECWYRYVFSPDCPSWIFTSNTFRTGHLIILVAAVRAAFNPRCIRSVCGRDIRKSLFSITHFPDMYSFSNCSIVLLWFTPRFFLEYMRDSDSTMRTTPADLHWTPRNR